MRNIFLIILIISITSDTFSQIRVQVDSLKKEIRELTKKLDKGLEDNDHQNSTIEVHQKLINDQNNRIESQTSLIDTAFDGVSAQLTASSNFIGIFGIIIAVFTTGLSIYVGRIARNVTQMKSENEVLLQTSIAVKQDIEQLSEKITKNTRGLYLQLRKEEINHILNRLILVPEDITNVFSSLASDELDETHFLQMKEAYMQISNEPEYADIYLIQFFQHFAGKSIVDAELRDSILAKLDTWMEACFKNDIVKSTIDYFTALYRKGIGNSVNEINAFAKSIGRSKFNEFEQVYFAIKNALPNREQHFFLYRLIENDPETIPFRKKYGQLLMDYRADNPSQEENLIFEQVDALN